MLAEHANEIDHTQKEVKGRCIYCEFIVNVDVIDHTLTRRPRWLYIHERGCCSWTVYYIWTATSVPPSSSLPSNYPGKVSLGCYDNSSVALHGEGDECPAAAPLHVLSVLPRPFVSC